MATDSPAAKPSLADELASPPGAAGGGGGGGDAEAVRVAARLRPVPVEAGDNYFVHDVSEDQTTLSCSVPDRYAPAGTAPSQTFTFDNILDPDASQDDTFDAVGREAVVNAMLGFNGTIFAYGQTGSGKTHALFGPDIKEQRGAERGIVPRALASLFDLVAATSSSEVESFSIRASFLEVHNEQVNCLLDASKKRLSIRESTATGVYVEGLTMPQIADLDDAIELLLIGAENRAVAATRANERSSRSHCVFAVHLEARLPDGARRRSTLNLCDLAGSETVKKTGATGSTLKEATNINKSLSALSLCIKALTDTKATHVPFRDSKLTRLLQDSLGGNTKTALLVCVWPHHTHFAETLSTLRFAARAKALRTRAAVNLTSSPEELQRMVRALRREVAALRRENAAFAAGGARVPSGGAGLEGGVSTPGGPRGGTDVDDVSLTIDEDGSHGSGSGSGSGGGSGSDGEGGGVLSPRSAQKKVVSALQAENERLKLDLERSEREAEGLRALQAESSKALALAKTELADARRRLAVASSEPVEAHATLAEGATGARVVAAAKPAPAPRDRLASGGSGRGSFDEAGGGGDDDAPRASVEHDAALLKRRKSRIVSASSMAAMMAWDASRLNAMVPRDPDLGAIRRGMSPWGLQAVAKPP